MISFAQMKERIAQKLGKLAVGQSLSFEDGQLIEQKCKAIQKQLEALDIATVDFDYGTDESQEDILGDMVAAICVDEFLIPEPRRSTLRGEGLLGLPKTSTAERRLRKLLTVTRPSKPVRSEYF